MALRRLLDDDDFDDMDFKEILLKHIAPGLGCIIAFLMFASPLKAVLQVRATKHLGDLNPLPMVATVANCIAFLLYGCLEADPYVILSNEPGLLMGVFMTVSCYGFADVKTRDLMLKALLFFTLLLSGVGITIALFVEEDHTASAIAGYTAVFVLLCYYGAPLSTIAEVLRSRSAASLYWPISVMATVNGALWVAYGTAVGDMFIAVPNAVGATFGLLQLALIRCYPAKKAAAGSGAAAGGGGGEYEPLVQGGDPVLGVEV